VIPLRDSEASRRFTATNSLLILLNCAVFLLEISLGPNAESALMPFAMVPAQISHLGLHAAASGLRVLATLVTSLFLHGGLLHIAGNMLYLFIFGPAVEQQLGHLRYLFFYLLAGVAACLAMVAMGPESAVPVIGASGAIAGVLGAYFVLHPRGRITTILPIFVIELVEIPAIFYLLVWFAVQLYAGIRAGAQGPLVGGVAWWAHVGGFLFGVAVAPLLTPRRAIPSSRRR
jgi:membrane associated rhomboid family serine protease